MFTCNNYNLLTFTYYLKFFLAINMTIVPFIFFFINFIQAIKQKKKHIKFTKYFIIDRSKSLFYVFSIFILSFIIHSTLNNNNSACYIYANTKTYYEYKDNYEKLSHMEIETTVKNQYLENVLTNKKNENINTLVNKTNDDNNVSEEVNIDNYLHETNTNQLNRVYIIDGVFYYPGYVYGNRDTYSGMYCPNNPEAEGFNNPYGYNNYFYTRLTRFIDEASKNGYKITMSTQGCRSYSTQSYYYSTMTPGRAAKPGISFHGFGIASDLEFYQSDGSVCSGYRTDTSCPSMSWAHQNAERFGLTFPLLNASYREDWHIEPISKQKY